MGTRNVISTGQCWKPVDGGFSSRKNLLPFKGFCPISGEATPRADFKLARKCKNRSLCWELPNLRSSENSVRIAAKRSVFPKHSERTAGGRPKGSFRKGVSVFLAKCKWVLNAIFHQPAGFWLLLIVEKWLKEPIPSVYTNEFTKIQNSYSELRLL